MLENVMPFQLKPISFNSLKQKSSTEQIAKIRYEYHESKRMALVNLILKRKQELANIKVAIL
jgi:hypothetical protein